MADAAEQLRTQWANPGDILSLLLLIGGDIVQKAIAQLVGHRLRVPGIRGSGIPITPVAFSFGWAAYAFSVLLAATGDMRLMPTNDSPSMTVNCSNGFARETRSWVLGRLLRDHEIRSDIDPRDREEGGRAESIRIDIFELGAVSTPDRDFVWWLGWITILAQIGIAIVPWALFDDWGIMIVTLCGNLLAAVTSSMPQWMEEKWAGRKLQRDKVTCLTRGNGHLHVMVLLGAPGSWDVETLATGILSTRSESRWISLLLAILWTCLLISISGLREHTWFLIAIGGIGMLQNVFAAGITRKPRASNFNLEVSTRVPTIIGRRQSYTDDADAQVNLEEDLKELADVAAWAALTIPGRASPHDKVSTMPKWLTSMSGDDGIPTWLEPLGAGHVRKNSDGLPSGHQSSAIKPQLGKVVKKSAGIVYAIGVQGALIELEKWVPTAGLAMTQTFFPAGLKYNDESMRDNIHKKFWKRAHHTRGIREKVERERRFQARVPKLNMM